MSNWAVEIPHPAGRICCYKNPTHNPHIIADRGPSCGSATSCRKTNSVAGGTCWWQQWYHWCILYIDVISHKHYFGSSLVFANEDCRQHVDKRLCNACENWKPSRPGRWIPKVSGFVFERLCNTASTFFAKCSSVRPTEQTQSSLWSIWILSALAHTKDTA